MLLEALKRGVPEQRIAKALNVDIHAIRTKVHLLDGICPEVVDILRDRHVSTALFAILRKMKPAIQIATAELMVLRNDFTAAFARTRLAFTPPDLLIEGAASRRKASDPAAAQLILEDDTEYLVQDLKRVEASVVSRGPSPNHCTAMLISTQLRMHGFEGGGAWNRRRTPKNGNELPPSLSPCE